MDNTSQINFTGTIAAGAAEVTTFMASITSNQTRDQILADDKTIANGGTVVIR